MEEPGSMAEARGVQAVAVWKRFSRSGRWVLNGIDASLAPGAVTCVVGGNGSGKSTFLRTVAGASRPTRGRMVRPAGPIGYVPERLPTGIRMDARQYVGHMGRLRGMPAHAVAARAEELFERLALRPGPTVPVGELSKGNSQKVALVQALLEPTRLLVLDEPYSGLDPAAEQALTELVRDARAAGTTVVLSAHDPAVFPAADALFQVVDGRLTAIGPPPAAGPPTKRTRLMLRRRDPRAAPAALAGLPGVEQPGWDEYHGLLTLRTADPDAVLSRAIAAGWSFVEGAPEPVPTWAERAS